MIGKAAEMKIEEPEDSLKLLKLCSSIFFDFCLLLIRETMVIVFIQCAVQPNQLGEYRGCKGAYEF